MAVILIDEMNTIGYDTEAELQPEEEEKKQEGENAPGKDI